MNELFHRTLHHAVQLLGALLLAGTFDSSNQFTVKVVGGNYMFSLWLLVLGGLLRSLTELKCNINVWCITTDFVSQLYMMNKCISVSLQLLLPPPSGNIKLFTFLICPTTSIILPLTLLILVVTLCAVRQMKGEKLLFPDEGCGASSCSETLL